MKSFLVLLFLSFPAFATESKPEKTVIVDRKFCNVTTWGAYWSSKGRCKFPGDVMVGFDFTSNSAMCANLSVNCPTRAIEEAEKLTADK